MHTCSPAPQDMRPLAARGNWVGPRGVNNKSSAAFRPERVAGYSVISVLLCGSPSAEQLAKGSISCCSYLFPTVYFYFACVFFPRAAATFTKTLATENPTRLKRKKRERNSVSSFGRQDTSGPARHPRDCSVDCLTMQQESDTSWKYSHSLFFCCLIKHDKNWSVVTKLISLSCCNYTCFKTLVPKK